MPTPDVYCRCGCLRRYLDDSGKHLCCLCREISSDVDVNLVAEGPYKRDSDFSGGSIVEFVGRQFRIFCENHYIEPVFADLCVRCGVEYRLGKGICWKCSKQEASGDDGC